MLLTRRKLITGCAGGAVALAASPAGSQPAYPSKTITLVVPYPAGGTTDLLGRMAADQFKTGMVATVIVENKPGAGTIFGASQVAKAQPDGYTLLMATSTTLAINKTLYRTSCPLPRHARSSPRCPRAADRLDAGQFCGLCTKRD